MSQITMVKKICFSAFDEDVLEKFVRMDKDINNKKDVFAYLKFLLMVDDLNDLAEKLSRHPYFLNVPFKDIADTFTYLIKCGFRRPHIHKVLWIILYPL